MKNLSAIVLATALLSGAHAEDYLVDLFSDEAAAPPDESIEFGGMLGLSYRQQEFDKSASTNVSQLNLGAYLSKGAWRVGGQLPMLKIEGEQIVVNGRPQIVQSCAAARERYFALTPQQQFRFRTNRPEVFSAIESCQDELFQSQAFTDSGLGDGSVYTSYSYQLHEHWYIQPMVLYKLDNASSKGLLGSGTQDIMTDVYIDWLDGNWQASLLLGRSWVVGGDNQNIYQDFNYASLELRYVFNATVSVRGSYYLSEQSLDESLYIDAENPNQFRLNLDIRYLSLDWFATATYYGSDLESFPTYGFQLGANYHF